MMLQSHEKHQIIVENNTIFRNQLSMKLFISILLACMWSVASYCQTPIIPDSLAQKTIMKIDTNSISVKEFAWFNNKYNAYPDPYIQLSLSEYATLFTNYKRKVFEAIHQQLDTSKVFKEEFNSYMRKISTSYLYSIQDEKDLIQLEYDRLQTDYEVQHIFVKSDIYSHPNDTLQAYKKAVGYISELRTGKDFSALASRVSDDTFTKENGGYVGYITSLLMPLEYENAVYNGKVGEIVGPVSTKHGYFIIKILNARKSLGQRRASIITLYPNEKNESEWQKIKLEADSIYNCLHAGCDFDSLAQKKNKNRELLKTKGDIGWFDNSINYHYLMKEAVFQLDSIGAVTKPIKMSYGYVICKLTGINNSLPSFLEIQKVVQKIMMHDDTRSNWKEREAIRRYKKQYQHTILHKNLEDFITQVDNSILLGKWEKPTFTNNKELVKFANNTYLFSDFAAYLEKNQKHNKFPEKDKLIRYRFEQYIERILIYEVFQNIIVENEELQMLSQEYHHGMIMYELMQKEVYKKAFEDSVGLYEYYNNNINSYMNPESVSLSYFYCETEKIRKKTQKLLSQRPLKHETDSLIISTINKKNTNNVRVQQYHIFKGENNTIDALTWKAGNVIQLDSLTLVYINNSYDPIPKPFNEVKNTITTQYQNILEQNLIEYLQEKYPVTLFENVLQELSTYYE